MAHLTESTVEQATLAWLEAVGWRVAHGPASAPDTPTAERAASTTTGRQGDGVCYVYPTIVEHGIRARPVESR